MILDQGLSPERASSGKWVKYKQSLSVLVLVLASFTEQVYKRNISLVCIAKYLNLARASLPRSSLRLHLPLER